MCVSRWIPVTVTASLVLSLNDHRIVHGCNSVEIGNWKGWQIESHSVKLKEEDGEKEREI